MAERKALVQIGGQLQELPAGDTLQGASSTGGGVVEPASATYAYDTAGNLSQVTEMVGGTPRVTVFVFNADKSLHSVSETHLGLTETITYSYTGSAVTSYIRS